MSTTQEQSSEASGTGSAGKADMRLEVLVIPVSDVDRTKEFYGGLGWRLDADRGGGDFRLVQFTPPGSGCSVQFGTNLTSAEPGSAQVLLLAVSDIEAVRHELVVASRSARCTTARREPPAGSATPKSRLPRRSAVREWPASRGGAGAGGNGTGQWHHKERSRHGGHEA